MINPLRGMKDLMFDDARRFEYIVSTASTIARRYGYEYIETPILEETALFKRSVGESSDIVGKEMYQFADKGGNDVCLRPEGTAGVVRAYISAKLDRQQGKNRFFYYGPMFRYERPQKGRLRQFHQFGCESFGEASVYEDFTIIQMIAQIFDALGIGYTLLINSLGCPTCMPAYRDGLVAFLEEHKGDLCADCNRRIATNPIRTLDCKNEQCQSILHEAPRITHNLCASCSDDFEKLKALLDDAQIAYEVDTGLVRGLDYYSKTAFEFVSTEIGAQSAIAGGGRYDRLVEFLDGKPTPAIGFAIGIERIMELVAMPQPRREGYYLGAMVPEALPVLLDLAARLRHTERVAVEYAPKGFKGHMKGADKAGARFAVLIGESELNDATVWLKDLESQEERILPRVSLIEKE
jgi:histidyl-tRNA synthetase